MDVVSIFGSDGGDGGEAVEYVVVDSVAGGEGDADEPVSSDTTEDEESAEEAEVEKAARDFTKGGKVYPEMPPGGIWVGTACSYSTAESARTPRTQHAGTA